MTLRLYLGQPLIQREERFRRETQQPLSIALRFKTLRLNKLFLFNLRAKLAYNCPFIILSVLHVQSSLFNTGKIL